MINEVPNGFRVLSIGGDRIISLNPNPTTETAAVTILLGENGVGKSRLLGNIAKSFSMAYAYQISKGKPSVNSHIKPKYPCAVDYQIRGKKRTLTEITSQINLPRALVAVSMSAFHKFPSNFLNSHYARPNDTIESEFYHLVGTSHSNVGRSALSTALYSLVDNFSSENHDSDRISNILGFLKYKKKLTIEFGRRISRKDLDLLLINPKDFLAEFANRRNRGGSFAEQRLLRFLETEKPSEVKKLISNIKKFNDKFPTGPISIHWDFDEKNKDSINKLKIISSLARFGIATPRNLLLFKNNEESISLAEASSGELVITTIILGIANAIQENSLILIDEPEISLHPAWQQTFLRLLLEAFSEFKSCHFIIATHSPLIVSEAAEFNADVISMSPHSETKFTKTDGVSGSIEEIMLETFKVPTPNNRYLLERLTDLTKLAATHKISPEQFNNAIKEYALQVSRMRDDDPQKKLFSLMATYGSRYATDK